MSADGQIDALQAAERPLDGGQFFVGQDRIIGTGLIGRD